MSSFSPPRPTKRERREQARAERLAAEQAATVRATRRRRIVLLAGVAGIVALAMLTLVLTTGRDTGAPAAGEAPAGVAEVREMLAGIPQDGIVLGDPDAPVTLVEFADMQCPFCRDFALQTLPLIVRDYVRPGKVRLEFQTLAFLGPDSERAARAVAGAAAQDRLWHLTHLFYFNQGTENSGYATDAFLDALAGSVAGLDAARVRPDGQRAAADRLLADADALAARHGIASTPSFLLGRTTSTDRQVLTGVQDYDALRRRIDALVRG